MATTIGLDVGGAHLKVAVLDNGQLTRAEQIACPLWQGLDKLDAALQEAQYLLNDADQIAITMTGELSDLFETRRQGVETLVDILVRKFGGKATFWRGTRGFGTPDQAKRDHQDVGSTNFLATAHAVAQHAPNALLIDMGSTTTDIIPITNARACPHGLTDAQRQQTGELVYTGLTRTAVMAVTNNVPFKGHWQTLAREHLATMADIHRLLGELPDSADILETADGRGKSFDESLARFARMLGREPADLASNDTPFWKPAAIVIADQQLRSIEDGVYQVLSANAQLDSPTIITAGIGAHVAAKVAIRLGFPYATFGKFIGAAPDMQEATTHNAPAVAVALLSAC